MARALILLFVVVVSLVAVTTQLMPLTFALSGMGIQPQIVGAANATITNGTVTVQETKTHTVTSNSTTILTFVSSTTLTFPLIVQSTTFITDTRTATTTTTQTTNALAQVWENKDTYTIAWIALFAVICLVAVVIFKLAGRTGKRVEP